jgi:hypothetical protein
MKRKIMIKESIRKVSRKRKRRKGGKEEEKGRY